jgi:hypothetical protein
MAARGSPPGAMSLHKMTAITRALSTGRSRLGADASAKRLAQKTIDENNEGKGDHAGMAQRPRRVSGGASIRPIGRR